MFKTFETENLAKVSKYTFRLRKAYRQQNYVKLNDYLDHFKYHVQTGGEDDTINKKLEKLDEIVKKINDNKDNYSIVEIQKKLEESQKELNTKNTELEDIKKQLNESTEKLQQINSESPAMDNKMKELNEQITNLEKEKSTAEEARKTAEEALVNIQTELDKTKSQEQTLIEKINKYNEIVKKIMVYYEGTELEGDELEKFQKASDQIAEKLKNANELKTKNDELTVLLETSQKTITDLNEKLVKFDELTSKIQELETEVNKLNKELNEEKIKLGECNTNLAEKENELVDLKQNNSTVATNLDSKIKELLVAIYGNDITDKIMEKTAPIETVKEKQF